MLTTDNFFAIDFVDVAGKRVRRLMYDYHNLYFRGSIKRKHLRRSHFVRPVTKGNEEIKETPSTN